MILMPPGAVTQMRRVYEMSLPDTCTVSTPGEPTIDPETGWETPGTPTEVTVACRISPMDHGDESMISGQQQALTAYVITVPADTEINATSHIESGDRTFSIQGFSDKSWEIGREVWCTETNAGVS